jgi:hypothetical protein
VVEAVGAANIHALHLRKASLLDVVAQLDPAPPAAGQGSA